MIWNIRYTNIFQHLYQHMPPRSQGNINSSMMLRQLLDLPAFIFKYNVSGHCNASFVLRMLIVLEKLITRYCYDNPHSVEI